uniref:Uncharacterized protein n=1 Tax=Anguilla anguilla TaxID=7936 RepID=A0A0E9PII1_ANGAN
MNCFSLKHDFGIFTVLLLFQL